MNKTRIVKDSRYGRYYFVAAGYVSAQTAPIISDNNKLRFGQIYTVDDVDISKERHLELFDLLTEKKAKAVSCSTQVFQI